MVNFIKKYNVRIAISVLVVGMLAFIVALQRAESATVCTVPQGCTGSSSFTQYPIAGAGSTGALVSTSTPTVAGITATSTSASSTIQRLNVTQLSVTSTTATSTFSNGIQLSNGCFLDVGGNCISSGITSLNSLTGATQTFSDNDYVDIVSAGTVHTFTGTTSPVFGTLTATSSIGTSGNRIPNLWVGTGDITTLTAGTIVINQFVSGNLDVTGDTRIYGGDINLGTGLATTTLTTSAANVLTITGGGYVAQASSTVVGAFRTSGQTLLMNGNVGIGTTSPTNLLEVNGTSYTTNLIVSSGGSLGIPYGVNPTLSIAGRFALNTTNASSGPRWFDGTEEKALYVADDKALNIASTTLTYNGAYGTAGTTTLRLANWIRPITVNSFFCAVDGDTSATIAFGTGSATTSYVIATGAGRQTMLSSNNTWTARQTFYGEFGTRVGNPNYISCTLNIEQDAD